MEAHVDSDQMRYHANDHASSQDQIWIAHCSANGVEGEVVNSKMPIVKQEVFEEVLNVPEDEMSPWIRVGSTILSYIVNCELAKLRLTSE